MFVLDGLQPGYYQPLFCGCAAKRAAGAKCLLASGKTAPCRKTLMELVDRRSPLVRRTKQK